MGYIYSDIQNVTTYTESGGAPALEVAYDVTTQSITANMTYVSGYNAYGLQLLDSNDNAVQSSTVAPPGSDSMAHATINGLTANTTYRCRCWASNAGESAPGGGG